MWEGGGKRREDRGQKTEGGRQQGVVSRKQGGGGGAAAGQRAEHGKEKIEDRGKRPGDGGDGYPRPTAQRPGPCTNPWPGGRPMWSAGLLVRSRSHSGAPCAAVSAAPETRPGRVANRGQQPRFESSGPSTSLPSTPLALRSGQAGQALRSQGGRAATRAAPTVHRRGRLCHMGMAGMGIPALQIRPAEGLRRPAIPVLRPIELRPRRPAALRAHAP